MDRKKKTKDEIIVFWVQLAVGICFIIIAMRWVKTGLAILYKWGW